jgi:hypothetical protein
MTRTDFTASSRPRAATAGSISTPSRRPSVRRILAASAVLALMLPTASAFAAETGTSNYNQAPPVKTPPAVTPPHSHVGPKREASPPQKTPTTTPPRTTTSPPATLPFTGLDLRWVIGAGVLLMGAGLSLRVMQRKDTSR